MAAGGEVERLCRADRILVLGPSGAGKTELALRLGELLGLPLVHLDAHRWRPGWVALPDRDWRPVVSLEELLSAWEASRKPAERREILMEIVRRVGDEDDMAVLWRLLRQAPPREAEALLHVVYLLAFVVVGYLAARVTYSRRLVK